MKEINRYLILEAMCILAMTFCVVVMVLDKSL